MANDVTDFGKVADDLSRAAASFALLVSQATIMGSALREFREFEKQLTLTNAIAGGTEDTFRRMSQAAEDFSLVTTTTALEAGRALQNLAQAGFDAEQSLSAMAGVLTLAQATMADVAFTSDLLTSNIRAFGLETTDAIRVSNVFAAAITGSLASMDKLAFAMRQVAPVAELANLEIEETTAFLSELFNIGLRGEQAGTALRNVIIRLVRPMGEAQAILTEFSIATKTSTGEFRNLADILRDIGESGISDAQLARIFETEALAGAKQLIKSVSEEAEDGATAYQKMLQSITGTDRALELAAANLSTLDAELQLMRNNITAAARDFGEELAPMIREVAEQIVELMQWFTNLDDGTQRLIVRSVALGTTFIAVGAAVGALVSAFRVLGGGLMIKSIANIGLLTGAANLATGAMTAMRSAAIAGVASYTITGSAAAAAGAGVTALGTSFATATAAAAAFLAPIAAVGGALVAVGAYARNTYDDITFTANEMDAMLDRNSEALKPYAGQAEETVDALLGPGVVDLVASRVANIQKELAVLTTYSLADQLAASGRKQVQTQDAADITDQLVEQLIGGTEEEVAEAFRRIKVFEDFAQSFFDDRESKGIRGAFNRAGLDAGRQQFLQDYLDGLTGQQKALLDVMLEEYDRLEEVKDEGERAAAAFRAVEIEAVNGILEAFKQGENELSPFYDAAAVVIGRSGLLNSEAMFAEIAERITDPEGAMSEEEIVRTLLEAAGVEESVIIDLLTQEAQQRQQDLLNGIDAITADLATQAEDVRIRLLEQELARTENLAEGIRLSIEVGNARLEQDLSELSEKLTAQYAELLTQFDIDAWDGISEMLGDAIPEDLRGQFEDANPQFREMADGSWLIDSILDQIDETSTPEEIEAIIEQQSAMYSALMDSYVAAMLAAGVITDDQADSVRETYAQSTQLILDSILLGIGETTDKIETQRSQEAARQRRADNEAKRRASEAEREARNRERAQERAIKEAERRKDKIIADTRKLADFSREIEKQAIAADRAFMDAITGLSPEFRQSIARDREIEDITRRYDDQLYALRRRVEDLKKDFTGDDQVLAGVISQYENLISVTEAAKQAEIAATDNFVNQMARRGEAIDRFVVDMQNVAAESQSTYDKVGAGIAVAFAEYNRDLVTLIDITKDATTGFIDTLSSGIADFIYDSENAWENFKKNMLNISRKAFEQFTTAFIQQAISSLTGGPGSILGNALQPSPHGSEGVPGVGVGGFFSKLFPGLSGAFNAKGQQGTQERVAISMEQSAAALQSIAAQLGGVDSVLGTTLQDIQSGALTPDNLDKYMGAAFGGSDPAQYLNNTGNTLVDGIVSAANELQISAKDLATVISYETGGTFDPLQRGPKTQWGQHRGFIQFGEPQARQYGVDFSSEFAALQSQLGPDGAIVKYLRDHGFENGMGILDLYSTINAGAPGLYNRSDANNGGAAGNVYEKVTQQFDGHYANADKLLGQYEADVASLSETTSQLNGSLTDMQGSIAEAAQAVGVTDPAALATQGQFNPSDINNPLTGQPVVNPNFDPTAKQGPTGITGGLIPGLGGQGGQPIDVFNQHVQQFMTKFKQVIDNFGTQFQQALQQAIQAVQQAAGQSGGAPSLGAGFGGGFGGGLGSLVSLFGFSSGGFTGGQGKYTPAGIVHEGEWVSPQELTNKYGGMFEEMRLARNEKERQQAMLRYINGRNFVDGFSNGGFAGGYMSSLSGSFTNDYSNRSNNQTVTNNNRSGDNIHLSVTYNVRGDSTPGKRMRKSSTQQAKELAVALDKARRNS